MKTWTDIETSIQYGRSSPIFSADLGGGSYKRGNWLVRPELATLRLYVQEDGALTPYLRQRSLIGTPASACLSAQTPASSVKRGLQWTLLLGTAGQPRVKWALSQRGHAIEPLPFSCTMKLLRHKEEVSRVGLEPTTLCLKARPRGTNHHPSRKRFLAGSTPWRYRNSPSFDLFRSFSVTNCHQNCHRLKPPEPRCR